MVKPIHPYYLTFGRNLGDSPFYIDRIITIQSGARLAIQAGVEGTFEIMIMNVELI